MSMKHIDSENEFQVVKQYTHKTVIYSYISNISAYTFIM